MSNQPPAPRSAQAREFPAQMKGELDAIAGLIDEAYDSASEDQASAEETLAHTIAPVMLRALRDVVNTHQPREAPDESDGWICDEDSKAWPCTTALQLAAALAPDGYASRPDPGLTNRSIIADLAVTLKGSSATPADALAALEAARSDRAAHAD